jgi:hypothetical protein
MTDAARYLRQILLPEIGEAGQARIEAAAAPVGGGGLAHEVAARYALAAGFAAVTPGPIDVDALGPEAIVALRGPQEVLAGSRAALRAIRDAAILAGAPDRAPGGREGGASR